MGSATIVGGDTPEQAVNWRNLARPLGNDRKGSCLVGDDREALRVRGWGPVLGERADLAADDDG